MVIFIMNDDLESMWKEAVVAYFKVFSGSETVGA